MSGRSHSPRLMDSVEATERIQSVLRDVFREAFEADWERQWLVERGIEMISQAKSSPR